MGQLQSAAKYLTTDKAKAKQNIAEKMLAVKAEHNVGFLRQFYHMWRLGRKHRLITPDEYFNFGLFRDSLSFREKSQYYGYRRMYYSTMDRAELTEQEYNDLYDKLKYCEKLKGLGIPATTALASCGDSGFDHVSSISNPAALKAFLLGDVQFPVLGKPRIGNNSNGVVEIQAVDRKNNILQLRDGNQLALDDFCDAVFAHFPDNYLIQIFEEHHDKLRAFFGEKPIIVAINTARNSSGQVEVLNSYSKIAANQIFDLPRSEPSTAFAGINPKTGKYRTAALRNEKIHPPKEERFNRDGADILELEIPHYQRAIQMVLDIHAQFPTVAMMMSDLIITNDGPVVLESTIFPTHHFIQLTNDKGLGDLGLDHILGS